jgi:hypothetical protein
MTRRRSLFMSVVVVTGAGLPAAFAGDEWRCPADDLSGVGMPVVNVLLWGATGTGDRDDRPFIQAAIDFAHSVEGGVVLVPAGTYLLDGPLTLRSHVLLTGEGIDSVLQVTGDTAGIVVRGEADDVVRSIAVRDLHLRGPVGGGENNTLISMTQYVENARIERNTFANAGYDAWHALRDCSRICVLDNMVIGCGDDGLNPGGSFDGEGTHDVLVRGNFVDGAANDGIHVSRGSYDITVVENTILHCQRGVGLLSRDALVADNTITTCDHGVAILAGSNHVVRGNTIVGCERGVSTPNVPVIDARVLDNEVAASNARGIEVIGGSAVIAGNTVTGSGYGITVTSYGGVVADNVVEDSIGFGIVVLGGAAIANNRVLDNTVRRSGAHGISVDARCATIMRNTIRASGDLSIHDVRGYSRVALNDVDGEVTSIAGDVVCNEMIDVRDLLAVLEAWGPCDGPVEECPADLDADGTVGAEDLVLLLGNFGL